MVDNFFCIASAHQHIIFPGFDDSRIIFGHIHLQIDLAVIRKLYLLPCSQCHIRRLYSACVIYAIGQERHIAILSCNVRSLFYLYLAIYVFYLVSRGILVVGEAVGGTAIQELIIGYLQGRRQKAAHIHAGTVVESDAVRIDQEYRPIPGKTAVNLRCVVPRHTVQHHPFFQRTSEMHRMVFGYAEIRPIGYTLGFAVNAVNNYLHMGTICFFIIYVYPLLSVQSGGQGR